MKYWVTIGEEEHEVDLPLLDSGATIKLDGEAVDADVCRIPGGVSCVLNGQVFDLITSDDSHSMTLASGQVRVGVRLENERERGRRRRKQDSDVSSNELAAPMPGRVVKVLVAVGATVDAGDPLIVIEAMKMENELRAAGPATVRAISVSEGQAVEAGAALMSFEPHSTDPD